MIGVKVDSKQKLSKIPKVCLILFFTIVKKTLSNQILIMHNYVCLKYKCLLSVHFCNTFVLMLKRNVQIHKHSGNNITPPISQLYKKALF